MRRINTVFFLLLFTSLGVAQECELRYDGLYVTKADVDGEGVLKYLRFYPDSVVSVLSEDKIDTVSQWIAIDVEDISKGKYKAKKCKLKFTTENSTGEYKHKGTIEENGNTLYLEKYYEEWPEPQSLEFRFVEKELKH